MKLAFCFLFIGTFSIGLLAQKNSNEILINFIPPTFFTRISFSDLYNVDTLREIDKKIDLRDKILLI